MIKTIWISVRMYAIALLVLGVAYPLLVTGLAQGVLGKQANGSLVRDGRGTVVGSELIGQRFSSARYFHPRPSAAGDGYDALASGGSNLGPTSRRLAETVTRRADEALAANPGLANGAIPVDMITASASGLDPDVSPANAYAQAARVARARRMSEDDVRDLVRANVRGRDLGFIGEPRVNVLALNRALDER